MSLASDASSRYVDSPPPPGVEPSAPSSNSLRGGGAVCVGRHHCWAPAGLLLEPPLWHRLTSGAQLLRTAPYKPSHALKHGPAPSPRPWVPGPPGVACEGGALDAADGGCASSGPLRARRRCGGSGAAGSSASAPQHSAAAAARARPSPCPRPPLVCRRLGPAHVARPPSAARARPCVLAPAARRPAGPAGARAATRRRGGTPATRRAPQTPAHSRWGGWGGGHDGPVQGKMAGAEAPHSE